MKTFSEWCEFFRQIESNPKAIVSGLRIRDVIAGREHLNNCDDCAIRVDRTLANRPKDDNRIPPSVN